VRTLVLVSDDYWGARAAEICERQGACPVIDRTLSATRALKLVLRGSLPLPAALAIWQARRSLPQVRPQAAAVSSNASLRALCAHLKADRLLLFRAGLIISGEILKDFEVQNIHCADIRGFGGLAAIHRALRVGCHEQCATLHRVTSRIDEGEILDTEPFRLDPERPYAENEFWAYEAGLRLLERTLAP
jgi:methionyl-tRNA formyltransferase